MVLGVIYINECDLISSWLISDRRVITPIRDKIDTKVDGLAIALHCFILDFMMIVEFI